MGTARIQETTQARGLMEDNSREGDERGHRQDTGNERDQRVEDNSREGDESTDSDAGTVLEKADGTNVLPLWGSW